MAIVGAGFAGSLTATQLLRQATDPLEILLVERRVPFGPGRAFANTLPCHLLNVPVAWMSAYPDDPDHLARWLKSHSGGGTEISAAEHAFIPRATYGAYIAWTLAEAENRSRATLRRGTGEVVAIQRSGTGATLRFQDGAATEAAHVVLAVGNPPPNDPPEVESLRASARYAPDPWSEDALSGIEPDDPVVTIGSNLTMVDVALTLHHRGHRGTLLAVSTHGLLPTTHAALPPPEWTSHHNGGEKGPRPLMRAIRHEVATATSEGFDWRSVVDALRPRLQAIWSSWPETQRHRFLRHARPYWEVHRHRMAPENAATIEEWLRGGRLRVIAGRITAARETPKGLAIDVRRRGRSLTETLRAARLVNCTGPGMDLRRSGDPLMRDLFARGLARPGPLGIGIDADSRGALLDAAGDASPVLSTLGPPLKGLYWETTAVREIRVQAETLAHRLRGDLR